MKRSLLLSACILLIVIFCLSSASLLPAFADSVTSTISVGNGPSGLSVNPITNKIYVANFGIGKTISVIDGSTDSVSATINVSGSPKNIVVDSATDKIYANIYGSTPGPATVSVIDGATNQVTGSITVGTNPDGMALNPNNNELYVANQADGTVSIISTTTDTVLATLPVGGNPIDVAVNPTTGMVYVTNVNGYLTVIDGSNNLVTKLVTKNNSGFQVSSGGVAVDPNTNTVYTASDNAVDVFDGATNSFSTLISLGTQGATDLAINPVTHRLYVDVYTGGATPGTVMIVDTLSNFVVGSPITVGIDPGHLDLNANANKVYIPNYNDNTVTVISGPEKLAFKNPPLTIPVGVPSGAISVWTEDYFGNKATVDNPTTISLKSSSLGGTFYDLDGVTQIFSVTIPSGSYSASFLYKDGIVGKPTITVSSPDLTSGTQQETVIAAPTGTSLSSSQNPSIYGQSITFKSTVFSQSAVPNGEVVTFYDGVNQVGTGTTTGGVATFTTSSLSIGSHTMSATYSGDTTHAASTSSPLTQTVNPESPNTLLFMFSNATSGAIVGQKVNFTYIEENNGNVPLTNPSVSDNSCSPVLSHIAGSFNEGDTNTNGMLDSGESWVFQCIQQENTAGTFTHTATGHGLDPLGNDITAPAYPSEQTSLSVTVNPASPNTQLSLSSNATNVVYGQTINFTYSEKNTGNVPLTSPSVSDNSCSPVTSHNNALGFNIGDTNENNILDIGETWVFQCIEKQTATGTITHTATGTGTDPSGNTITAPAYSSEQTSLSVMVTESPNTLLFGFTNATTTSTVGQRINFTYFEQNTGNVPLNLAYVTDSACSNVHWINNAAYNEGDTNNNGILDPGETWVFDCVEQQNATGTFTHTATGHGLDPLGNDITAPAYPSEQTSITVSVNPATTVTYNSATGSGPVTFSTSSGQISSFNVLSQSQLSTPPPSGSYPFGFFTWAVTGLSNGGSTTVSITYPSDPGTVYEKLIAGTWYAIAPTSKTTNPNGSVTITLTVTDGAAGQDADQTVNGQITDPGGMVAVTPAKVTGGGSLGKDISFGLVGNSLETNKTKGEVEYHDKIAKIDLHSTDITFLSADSTFTHATIQGKAKIGDKPRFTFQVNISDPDKTGDHDQFSIVLADSTGKTVYQHNGVVKGHIEIHKINASDKGDNDQEASSK